ncbi:conjugal transfer protein [Pectobacterium atrosepticum ICMP 1526]|uniref:type IV secretion system protein VirB10 n=1 Tax=Pectobacterium atrosepticum TaxID=29471 RepID=UPI0005065757|nr:type IV secretion system protein VirB10 [Pectobacterium atrosepticum]KFX10706.1 conjugal transfer protein TraI [Pectobacterium atrosepticum]KMK87266.1 conjugal transfer protein [Pectobacterium atrosepticum ICMP 1526]
MSNDNNVGAIPSIEDGNGKIDLQGSRSKRAKNGFWSTLLIFGGGIVLIIGFAVFMVINALKGSEVVEEKKIADPTMKQESINGDSRGVDKLMVQIAERRRAEQEAADLARKKEEERKLKEEIDKQQRLQEELDKQSNSGRGAAQAGNNKTEEITPSQRKLSGKGLVYAGKEQSGASSPAAQKEGGGLNDVLAGGNYANGVASLLRNRDYLLGMGSVLPCVLKTKIVTTFKSITICQITKNIYSNNGKTLLLEAGTSLFGEVQNQLLQGQARVFINWTTAETIHGIRVRIDALGVDGLGAAGVPAWIDLHFWERFGNSIMLTFIDDAIATGSSRMSKSNSSNGIQIDSTQDGVKEMASIALENQINIPPTGYINQGELISVIVPRDTYFNNVYEIH